jgi:hypothetical protein
MHARAAALGLFSLLSATGCGSCGGHPAPVARQSPLRASPLSTGAPPGQQGPTLPVTPTRAPVASYEVHEWGLVRGDVRDRVYLAGPHRAPEPMPLAKPVLYFHRDGEGPLALDVEVTLSSGRVVEHWPFVGATAGPTLAWRGVTLAEGSCVGARYPSVGEAPCDAAGAGLDCESLALRDVETHDADCLSFAGASWNHLFYRGELVGAPPLPLEVLPSGGSRLGVGVDSYRVMHRGDAPIVGRLVRVRGGVASVIDAPAPGDGVMLEPPAGAIDEGARALAEALGAAGLTPDEVAAFRRAWDATLFPGTVTATIAGGEVAAATPMAGGLVYGATTDALLYVLPLEDAERLATLRFTPPPRAVRRAIVVWLDLASQRPGRESPF